jgi:hypothetical protein
MRFLPPPNRALDVVAPIVVYRLIGRRPSRVYVDDAMRATKAPGSNRLSDLVYWRTQAVPGDQIQDRSGGTLLVTSAGRCHPILLSEPRSLEVETAFTHAERALEADREIVNSLIAQGMLTEATPRRPKGLPTRPGGRLLTDDHPIIVEEPPVGIEALDAAAEAAQGSGARTMRRR